MDTKTFKHKLSHPTIWQNDECPLYFLTVCTKNRERYLSNDNAHEILKTLWSDRSQWVVGRYVIMPDHVHLFARPNLTSCPMSSWIKYWKSEFKRKFNNKDFEWQKNFFDHRIRTCESMQEKFEYVLNNPVRHGLAQKYYEWPYQGEIFTFDRF